MSNAPSITNAAFSLPQVLMYLFRCDDRSFLQRATVHTCHRQEWMMTFRNVRRWLRSCPPWQVFSGRHAPTDSSVPLWAGAGRWCPVVQRFQPARLRPLVQHFQEHFQPAGSPIWAAAMTIDTAGTDACVARCDPWLLRSRDDGGPLMTQPWAERSQVEDTTKLVGS